MAPTASTSAAPQPAIGDHPLFLTSLSLSVLNTPLQSHQGSEDYSRSVIEISDSDDKIKHTEGGHPIIVVAWIEVRGHSIFPSHL